MKLVYCREAMALFCSKSTRDDGDGLMSLCANDRKDDVSQCVFALIFLVAMQAAACPCNV
jgi:hypothetical protein